LLLDEYGTNQKVKGWYFNKQKGLVLTWYFDPDKKEKVTPFTDRMGKPCVINEDELVDLLWNWLDSDEAKTVEFGSWENNVDHDGDNDKGWRLYTEDWGCIKETEHTIDHYSIGAFKPVWLWYGK
jgi:hypothetical protein